MSDLETAVRQAIALLCRRYRVVAISWADDEAVTAILAAAERAAERAQDAPRPRTATGTGDGKPRTAARRTARPRAAR